MTRHTQGPKGPLAAKRKNNQVGQWRYENDSTQSG
jgi:hypothetical protein